MTGIIARIGIQQGRGSLIIVIGRGAALWNLIVANIWRGSNLFLPALSLTLYSSCLPALLKPNLKQPKKINNSSLQKLKLQKKIICTNLYLVSFNRWLSVLVLFGVASSFFHIFMVTLDFGWGKVKSS